MVGVVCPFDFEKAPHQMKIAAFTRYDAAAASTRQRLMQYRPTLSAARIAVDHQAFFSDNHVRNLGRTRRAPWLAAAQAYLTRLRALPPAVADADVIWIYAELFPFLPAWAERAALRSGKPVVYDFDDAFFLKYELHPSRPVRAALRRKFEPLLRDAAACFCGNRYLQDYASQFCANSIYLPTVVDTQAYGPAPAARRSGPPVVGWIGSPSTWRYVEPLMPLLAELVRQEVVRLLVIGAGDAARRFTLPGMEVRKWSLESEIADVQAMDIGIMPAVDEPWALGKCGYKLIQYMGCAVPVVASPIGAATQIVEHGSEGFLADTTEQWRAALTRLAADPALRAALGREGRGKVVRDYSIAAHGPRLVMALEEIAPSPR